MHKNKEKDKNALFKIPNPTHGGQPTNSQTRSENSPKFIVLHATDNSKLSNASSFLISKAVQENILIGYLIIKIRPCIPNPLGCFRCQSYGHGTASCRGVATCNKCSSTEHASEACTTEWRKCANCKGEHAAYSKICPKWQQEKEIQIIKVLENISYSEAKKRVVNILPPRASVSYANAVMTNTKSKKDTATQIDVGTQTEISHIETPLNIDNLISESHKGSPIAQKPITNNLIEQETILSPPETSHLSVASDTEVLMQIDKISIKRPATDIVQEAAKILKPSIRIESSGIQTTKEVEDVKLLSKKGKSRRSFSPIKYNSEKPKGSP
ncbi:uncharacterized protein TNCV_4524021 [Trichonephila clavipes]|nr:uncharacterized protein TNCV_4524021 [Trichonephila clavipes]